jgi:hypothetical protein
MLKPNDDSFGNDSSGSGRQRGGFFKRMARVPLQLAGVEEIRRASGRVIELISVVSTRQHYRVSGGIEVDEHGFYDLHKTALAIGTSIRTLEAILDLRRRQTCRKAYLCFGLGWAFFFFWLYRLATIEPGMLYFTGMVEFAPFCGVFFLLAFLFALQNYQIRKMRVLSAMQYLGTDEGFWPR